MSVHVNGHLCTLDAGPDRERPWLCRRCGNRYPQVIGGGATETPCPGPVQETMDHE